MTVSTLRPNATVSDSGVTVVGAGAHGALADDSDLTYVTSIGPPSDQVTVGMDDLTLPTGALLKTIALRARLARPSFDSPVLLVQSNVEMFGGVTVTWPSPTTITIRQISAPSWFTDGHIDAAQVQLMPASADSASARVYALYLDVTYVAKPELTIDTPVDASTFVDTNLPAVSWTPQLDSDGGGQYAYAVKVFTQAQTEAPGFDPNTAHDPVVATATQAEGWTLLGSETTWQITEPLPDGEYVVYVAVAQIVNGVAHSSGWSDPSTFTVDVLLPGEPTLALVPETNAARMRLDISADPAGDATTDMLEVQASYDGGETWGAIRTPEGGGLATPVDAAATLWDHDGGNGRDVTYRVRALHDYSGLFAASAWVESTAMWGSTNDQWLKHPTSPSLNAKVRIHAYGATERPARQGRLQPLGRGSLVVPSDTRAPWGGSIAFYCEDDDARAALDALVNAVGGLPLLLQVGVTDKRPDRWIVLGNQAREHAIDKAWVDATVDTFDWVEVPAP